MGRVQLRTGEHLGYSQIPETVILVRDPVKTEPVTAIAGLAIAVIGFGLNEYRHRQENKRPLKIQLGRRGRSLNTCTGDDEVPAWALSTAPVTLVSLGLWAARAPQSKREGLSAKFGAEFGAFVPWKGQPIYVQKEIVEALEDPEWTLPIVENNPVEVSFPVETVQRLLQRPGVPARPTALRAYCAYYWKQELCTEQSGKCDYSQMEVTGQQ